MEKKKNLFLDIILAFILPRRMHKVYNINFMLSFLLILFSAAIAVVSSNTRSAKDAEKSLDFPTLFTEVSGITWDNPLPHVSIEEGETIGYVYENGVKTEKKGTGTYLVADSVSTHHAVVEKDGKKIDFTLVFDTDVYSGVGTIEAPAKLTNFDLEGYLKQKRAENTEYVLYIYTLDYMYFLFNIYQDENGESTKAITQNLLLESDESNNTVYYLPKDASEIAVNEYGNIDTRLWTAKVKEDAKIDFTIPYEFQAYKDQIVPSTRHLENITNALYSDVVSYPNLQSTGMDVEKLNSSFVEYQKDMKGALIIITESQIKLMSLVVSLFISLIFPLLLALITWLISRGFYMNKYRQYYGVAAIVFFDTSLISAVVGFFVSYLSAWIYYLIFAALFYIVCTFRINSQPIPGSEEERIQQEEHKEPIKYQKIEEDSDISKIG